VTVHMLVYLSLVAASRIRLRTALHLAEGA
jgi:hypothetical protein